MRSENKHLMKTVPMPMSAEFAQIEAVLDKLDASCKSGELKESQYLFNELDTLIKSTVTTELLESSEQAQKSAINIFNHIQSLKSQLQQEKNSVAKELSQAVGNHKKIKAYTNI